MRRFTRVVAPAALVVAFVFITSSYMTHGIRTTPSALDSADDLQLELAKTAPSVEGQASKFRVKEESRSMEESAVTGSRLPDCTHACGPCSPCKRVMVSFRCVEASESCPVAYRCMCAGRFFRVPTL